jgi:cytochrome b involved in lipid metabolism
VASPGESGDADANANTNKASENSKIQKTKAGETASTEVAMPQIKLDQEVVDALPIMPLDEIRAADGLKAGEPMLVTYQGIVYDVTDFADHHPGGKELMKTAAGMDLTHFFQNYTVHGVTHKAANWLAPMAVGKLSAADSAAIMAVDPMDKAVRHVDKRLLLIGRARRKVLLVASSLPFWMSLRSAVRLIGWLCLPLGRLLARALPVTVPGLSPGAEPIDVASHTESTGAAPTVVVIGGGIAGCSAAWALAESGFKVTLFEARGQISGNARTFDWDFSPFRDGRWVG